MILPKADAGFFLMAAKRGFAEREGLKVEVLDVEGYDLGAAKSACKADQQHRAVT